MTYLIYAGQMYEITDRDYGRIRERYESEQPFGPAIFELSPDGGKERSIIIGSGIPLLLSYP